MFGNFFENERQRRQRRRKETEELLGSIPPNFWFVVVIILGVVMMGFGLFQSLDYARSRSWETVPGKIVDSRITVETRYENEEYVNYYKPLIRYRYTVNGIQYVSERVRLSDRMCFFSLCASDTRSSTSTDAATTRLAAYPLNMGVTVHYDPANPQTAALERNISFFIYFALGMGAFMILAGTLLILSTGQA